MLFPHRDTFGYYVETKDNYGTITRSSASTHKAYIEQQRMYSIDGTVISKGKIFTTDTTSFKVDAHVIVDSIEYMITSVQPFSTPGGYFYQEISYV